MKVIDLTDQKFGRLTVIIRVGSRDGRAVWRCKCECGNETEVRSRCLINGHVKSCGCLAKERLITPGMYGTKIYERWHSMKRRCIDRNAIGFKNYGGRGITVCDEWLRFEPFYDWAMNNGYTNDLSIDRIDNNQGYCPENCRFSTVKEQNNNRRNNVWITFRGETRDIQQWAEVTGIRYRSLYDRLKQGWTIEKALTTPTRHKRSVVCLNREIDYGK